MRAEAQVKQDAKGVALRVAVMDAETALREHLQTEALNNHLFSDILLSFEGKDYELHRVVLSQSSYFRLLFTGPWREHGKSRIDLKTDDTRATQQGMEMAIHFLYGMNPVLTKKTVVAVLASASFLCLEKLCERCVQYMVETLGVDTFANYQQAAEKGYGRFGDKIRNACWAFLCTHASQELLNVLPKLPLSRLCQLLQADELWIPTELERYKLAKKVLIEWISTLIKSASSDSTCSSITRRMRGKHIPIGGDLTSSVALQNSPKGKVSQKSGRSSSKDRGSKKESHAGEEPIKLSPSFNDDVNDISLKRLKCLSESAARDQENVPQDDFRLVFELFTGGGIVFAHMEVDDILQVRKELEDANLPTAAADDSIWQHVLLKSRICKLREHRNASVESSGDEDDEVQDKEEDVNVYDEVVEEDDEEDPSERDSSDFDQWSSDSSSQEEDEGKTSDVRAGNAGNENLNSLKRNREQSTITICHSSPDGHGNDASEKRKKISGGFSWISKPDTGLVLNDFPPLRFGAEFVLKDKRWNHVYDEKGPKVREVFYGGSIWKMFASNMTHLNQGKEGWLFGVHCRPVETLEPHTYQDNRKKVRFLAKVYIKTNSGLSCVAGTGLRKRRHLASSFKNTLGMNLFREDVILDKPLRVSAVVQLIED